MALVMRPLIVLLLQPWSTATSQSRKRNTARAARPDPHNAASEKSLAPVQFGRKGCGSRREVMRQDEGGEGSGIRSWRPDTLISVGGTGL
jgi:hypothetical protein